MTQTMLTAARPRESGASISLEVGAPLFLFPQTKQAGRNGPFEPDTKVAIAGHTPMLIGEFKFHPLCELQNKCRYNGRCRQCRAKGKVSRKKICWGCILKNYRADEIESANAQAANRKNGGLPRNA